ncbi:hypothetical protein [Gulosibacter molinativorax]|uniref:Uncharacterized protein n=1 Tax=Gulosibacter molinativorax TaxID=256821 RepID=A0ABT7C5H6_9MICO|nr:hypothetical protein [Gulosibacter molinativorax]MDJ1370004.1 hypothetical protein [Gulosibacter molinativorax]QUY63806.1 Hypotetical protein [Gulosibacter molinativorax]
MFPASPQQEGLIMFKFRPRTAVTISAGVLLFLSGCAAQPSPASVTPTADETSAPDQAQASDPPQTQSQEPVELPANAPEGIEIDSVTNAWVYSDEVAILDLPQDPDDFLSEPIDSLPELPELDSLAGQQLADENGLVDVWDLQMYYVADCMADAGFEWRWVYYDPRFEGSFGNEGGEGDATPVDGYVIPGTWDDQTAGFQAALWGENDFMSPDYDPNYEYHWSTAGCDGYAVHVTGQDG